jgi:tricorn protease
MMVDISGDGKKVLLASGQPLEDRRRASGQSMDGGDDARGLMKRLNPREEWRQLVRDAWRRHRDFFYVANMHGVDWDAVYEQYAAMVDDAASREDVSFIIAEMISELNVGHAYYWGGDVEGQPSENVGLLGRGLRAGPRKTARRQCVPDRPDLRGRDLGHGRPQPAAPSRHGRRGGRLHHARQRQAVDTTMDPWAAFVGLAGQETTITVADALVGDEETR